MDLLPGDLLFDPAIETDRGADSVEDRRRHVGREIEKHEESLAFPILGEKAKPASNGTGGRRLADRLACKPNSAAVQRQAAENGVGQLRPSGADHSRDAENFALSRLEAHPLDAGAHHDVPRLDDDLADLFGSRLWRIDVGEIASDHHRDEPVTADLADRHGTNHQAILQDSGAVGDLEDLIEPMGDEHDRHTALFRADG